ncbi:hypothetical protein [Streptomyces sp. NPDC086519]|uniref:hypothetical protein n=1 Tax=Streptomyces sp. NPDC086519 TaxID=3154863 RepID=UPI00342B49C0
MKALVVNCTLKESPAPSGTAAPASVVVARPAEFVRAVGLPVAPGAVTGTGTSGGAERPSKASS